MERWEKRNEKHGALLQDNSAFKRVRVPAVDTWRQRVLNTIRPGHCASELGWRGCVSCCKVETIQFAVDPVSRLRASLGEPTSDTRISSLFETRKESLTSQNPNELSEWK